MKIKKSRRVPEPLEERVEEGKRSLSAWKICGGLYIYTQRGLKMWGGGGGGLHANRCECVDPCHFFDKNEVKFSMMDKLETIDWLDCHYFFFFFPILHINILSCLVIHKHVI